MLHCISFVEGEKRPNTCPQGPVSSKRRTSQNQLKAAIELIQISTHTCYDYFWGLERQTEPLLT